MSEVLTEILAKRRDRAIATILNVKEREVDPHLCQSQRGREASAKLRKVVLDQLNEIHDLTLDVLRSFESSEGVVLNEHYLTLLSEIHDALVTNGNGRH